MGASVGDGVTRGAGRVGARAMGDGFGEGSGEEFTLARARGGAARSGPGLRMAGDAIEDDSLGEGAGREGATLDGGALDIGVVTVEDEVLNAEACSQLSLEARAAPPADGETVGFGIDKGEATPIRAPIESTRASSA